MADDVVTRFGTTDDVVRDLLSGCICEFIGDGNCRCCRAADEIERLRAEVRALETERNQWQRIATRD